MSWLVSDEAVNRLKATVRCITFDLDDTLWDCSSVIHHAEAKLYAWFEHHYPVIAERYTMEELLPHRITFLADYRHHSHNLTHQRKLWLAALATEFELDKALVEPAFMTYWHARNEVTLYHGVTQALASLSSCYTLGAITNGNADVHKIGIGEFFDFVVRSEEVGCSKPDPEIFRVAAARSGFELSELLHVGDDLRSDVGGAVGAGAYAVWVGDRSQLASDSPTPLAAIKQVAELVELLQPL